MQPGGARKFRPFIGRFRCPDGRTVRLAGIRLPRAIIYVTADTHLSAVLSEGGGGRSCNPAHRVQAVVENDRQNDGRELSTQKGRTRGQKPNGKMANFEFKSKATRDEGSGAQERPVARLILCGVVVNIFTIEAVRCAVSWPASRSRGVQGGGFTPSCRSSWAGARCECWAARRRPRW